MLESTVGLLIAESTLCVLGSMWVPCKYTHTHKQAEDQMWKEFDISPCHFHVFCVLVGTVAQTDLYSHLVYTLWLENMQEVFLVLNIIVISCIESEHC